MRAAIAADRANEFRKLGLFLSFVSTARSAPERVDGVEQCGDAGRSGAGLCSKIYAAPDFRDTWLLNYAKEEVRALRIQAVFGNVVLSCSDLGKGQVVRAWLYGSAHKEHCAFSAGPLAGLHAILENYPGNARVLLFSPAYLERDLDFKALAAAEGAGP
jgi:hypothetical protein